MFWMNVLIGVYGWVNYVFGVLWLLLVEEVFYLLFLLLCIVLCCDMWLFVFWLLIVVIGFVYCYMYLGDEGGFFYVYFVCFDGIVIGCCIVLFVECV